jgi:DNA-binding Lrp family transcriptional regulator
LFFLKVSSGKELEVVQKMVEFEKVMQADIVFGEYEVIAMITTTDLEKIQDFVSDKVRTVPNVLVTSPTIISKEYKGRTLRPK